MKMTHRQKRKNNGEFKGSPLYGANGRGVPGKRYFHFPQGFSGYRLQMDKPLRFQDY